MQSKAVFLAFSFAVVLSESIWGQDPRTRLADLLDSSPVEVHDYYRYAVTHDMDALSRILVRHGMAEAARQIVRPRAKAYLKMLHVEVHEAAIRQYPVGVVKPYKGDLVVLSDRDERDYLNDLRNAVRRSNGTIDLDTLRGALSDAEAKAVRATLLRLRDDMTPTALPGAGVHGLKASMQFVVAHAKTRQYIEQNLAGLEPDHVAHSLRGWEQFQNIAKRRVFVIRKLQAEIPRLDSRSAETKPSESETVHIPDGFDLPLNAEISSATTPEAELITIEADDHKVEIIEYESGAIVVHTSETLYETTSQGWIADEKTTVTVSTTAVYGSDGQWEMAVGEVSVTNVEYVTVAGVEIGVTTGLTLENTAALAGGGSSGDLGGFVGADAFTSVGLHASNPSSGASQSLQVDIGLNGGGAGIHVHEHGQLQPDGGTDFSFDADALGVGSLSASQIGEDIKVKGSVGPYGVSFNANNPISQPYNNFPPSTNLPPWTIHQINQGFR